MNLLKYLGIAAFALVIPLTVQAAPLIEGGANNNLQNGVTYSFQEISLLPANILQTYTFALTPLAPTGGALSTVISISGGSVDFGSFTLTGPGGPLGTESVIEGPGNGFIAAISNISYVLGQPHTLDLAFSLTQAAEALVNVQVTAVPLPAAGLLLLGAIGGLGAYARRKAVL